MDKPVKTDINKTIGDIIIITAVTETEDVHGLINTTGRIIKTDLHPRSSVKK